MNEDVMQVRQFAGMQQERQDAFAQSTKPATAAPSVNGNVQNIDHQEVQSHGVIPRVTGPTSSFQLNQAPVKSALGQGQRAF